MNWARDWTRTGPIYSCKDQRQHRAELLTTPFRSADNNVQTCRQHSVDMQTALCRSADNTVQICKQHRSDLQTTLCRSAENTVQIYRQHLADLQMVGRLPHTQSDRSLLVLVVEDGCREIGIGSTIKDSYKRFPHRHHNRSFDQNCLDHIVQPTVTCLAMRCWEN